MSDLLKSVIQDLINDRTEQAQVTIHDYIVAKTQELAGLNEATSGPSKLGNNILWSKVKPGKYLVDVNPVGTYAPNIRPLEITAVSKEIGEPGEPGYTASYFTVTDLVTGKERKLRATFREVWPWNPTWINAEIERLRRKLENAPESTKEKRQKEIDAYEKLV